MATRRIMVVSDLHAHEDQDPIPDRTNDSYILTEPPPSRPRQNPLSDLYRWVEERGEKVDYLVVPGDVANKANGHGFTYAWNKLRELSELLEARLVAAPGNHDVVTHVFSNDPRQHLKTTTTFPTVNVDTNQQFWDAGWALLDEDPEVRFVLLDSTFAFPAFPIGVAEDSEEWRTYLAALDQGSFRTEAEDQIEEFLRNAPPKLNLFVLHHHPVEHQNFAYLQDEYGAMHRGRELIGLLSQFPTAGRWIIIHGHKHVPQLVNAISTSSSGPLVLCAASLGHRLWDPINTQIRNQFHLLEVTDEPAPQLPTLRGTVLSFFWGFGVGWARAHPTGSGLPGKAGFGCADDPRSLALQIVAEMNKPAPTPRRNLMQAEELLARFPQLEFQLPTDANHLRTVLEVEGFEIIENNGRILQLGRVI